MDKHEARLLLQAYRPNGADGMNPAFAEALLLAETDPELKAWWEAEQAFDREVAAKVAEIPVPQELRETILGRRKIVPMTRQPQPLGWLAAAAAIAILCVAWTFMHMAKYGPLDQEDYAKAVIPLLGNDSPNLAMQTGDNAKIAAWLKQQGAPMGTLPDKLAAIPPVGCQKFAVHGHTVSLICFAMAGGKIAHLFIVDEDAVEDPPGTSPPEFKDENGWRWATWSDGKMTYLLATTADANSLRQLL